MAQTLAEIMASLQPQYDAERAPISAQIAALPGQQAADEAGLNTAKTNAFNSITNAAGARGVLYSGVPINEQNTYVGEKYLPAVAGVKANYANKGFSLSSELGRIGAEQGNAARSIQTGQQRADAEAANNAAQLELKREEMANSLEVARTRASSAKTPDPAKGFNLSRDKAGGLQFTGPNGRPVTAAQYASVTGTKIRDLLASSGNPGDQQIIKLIDQGMSYPELAKRFPYIFSGV